MKINNLIVASITLITLSIVGAFVVVNIATHDTAPFMEFLKYFLIVLPIAVVQVVSLKLTGNVQDKVDQVETQTNGQLKAQFVGQTEELKRHIDSKIANVQTQTHAFKPDIPS